MLSLTRIYLHNWHRFHDHLIVVTDSLYLAGHNGSGKSSVLDALQLVLIGDLGRIRFNSSAQERFSARSLDTYVRGKIGENRFLRPGSTVAYVALEFTNSQTRDCLTLGACIEAAEGRSSERLYFSLSSPLDPGLFVVEGRELPRRELRQALRGRKGARTFEQVGEYQTDLLNRLGGLNERFFDLFIKALRFEPIRNIRDFVEQWVLPSRPLELETLQRVVERLKSLSSSVARLKRQLARLERVLEQQAEVRRLRGLHEQWSLVKAMLAAAAAQRALQQVQEQLARLNEQIHAGETEQAETQAALAGAQDALREAERQLYQSDVVRRRDELRERIAAQTHEADTIRRRWDELCRALRSEQATMQPLASDDSLAAEEQAVLRTLLSTLAALQPDTPPPASLPGEIEAAIPLLQGAAERTREARFELAREIRELKTRGEGLEAELARMKRDGRIAYRPEVERLRDLLAPVVDERPKLLCELLDVPDERWQDAVEAMLGPRRFNIIVKPTVFDEAVKVLDRARAYDRLYDVGLLDVARALRDARPALPGSLAAQVATNVRALRAYVDQVLGEIITCERVSELRRHRRAVTPEVVVYGEWTVRAVQPERFRPWFVGARAQRSQIESLERQRDQVAGDFQALVPKEAALAARLQRLEHYITLKSIMPRFEQTLDERPLRADCEGARLELDRLDLSGVAALEAEVTRLQGSVAQERARERELAQRLARWDEQRLSLETQAQAGERTLAERASDAANLGKQFPAAIAEAEKLRDQRLAQADLTEHIASAESTMKAMQTRGEHARSALIEDAAGYNTEYTFAARADDPGEERYAQEAERLRATELPSYGEDITAAQKEAEDELREHVLHKLREQVRNARVELDRLNEALAGRDFRGKRYRIRVEPNDSLREFYDLILGTELLGANSLFDSPFYRDHKAAFDRFYEALVRAPMGDSERDEQAKLTDYRRYLVYDIEVTLPDGQVSRLSRTMDQMSGGEVQTPFYLAIAASFVQLYRINERTARPTIRLVAFDEAFSKMDQDHIGSTLDLFQHFNLQVMTATPLERCEYLVPKMCTNLVLTAVADTVLIEPYVNYQARLAETYED